MARGTSHRPLTRAESKALNRQRLLNATRELLIEVGFGALSARRISARAGVAQSSFYAHFKDKEDIVRILSDEIFSRLRRLLRDVRQSTALTWEEMIAQNLRGLYGFFVGERALIALLFQELDQPGSPIAEIGEEIFRTLHRDYQEDLNRLVAQGRMPSVPVDALVTSLLGSCWYLLRRALHHDLEAPQELIQGLVSLHRGMVIGMGGE